MKNLVLGSSMENGNDRLEFTAPANLVSGQFVLVGELPCVVVADIANGETGTHLVKQVIFINKAAVAFAEGQEVFFDSGADEMTDVVGGGNKIVGHATKAAVGGDATVEFLMAPVAV